MKLAFCLFRYFPFGGLQRDFMRIANECVARGHQVDVFTMEWEGEHNPQLNLHIISAKGLQNHNKRADFVSKVHSFLEKYKYDLVVGFNKMPGLDVYYAADTCYQAKARKQHGWLYRLTSRYNHSVLYEGSVFSPVVDTKILLISKLQQPEFERYYHTPASRFHLLPPGIDRDRIAPENSLEIRNQLRTEFSIAEHEFLLLMVGSGFKTKGVDRTLLALASLPDELRQRCHLMIIGEDNQSIFLRLARSLGVIDRLQFLGGRSDVPRFLLGADILLHPAYNENTGTVLLEAITSGLPVLTTDVCGYAGYVEEANAGIVLPSPFKQEIFNNTLKTMLLSTKLSKWKYNALTFAKDADIYSLPLHAVDIIESLG